MLEVTNKRHIGVSCYKKLLAKYSEMQLHSTEGTTIDSTLIVIV